MTQTPEQNAAGLGEATFELYEIDRPYLQEPLMVASVTGSYADAWREINHYAMVYGQDGPVEIRRILEQEHEVK